MKLELSILDVEPIGIGTPMVESLYSYACRLAEANKVTLSELMAVLDDVSAGALARVTRLNLNWVEMMNSFDRRARVIIESIQMLTGRSGLMGLLSPLLHEVFGIFAWKKWKTFFPASSLGYEPLIYSIDGVIWDEMGIPLANRCPHCGHMAKLHHEQTIIGQCHICRQPLDDYNEFSIIKAMGSTYIEDKKDFGVWAAKSVGELLTYQEPILDIDLAGSVRSLYLAVESDRQLQHLLDDAGGRDFLRIQPGHPTRLDCFLKFCYYANLSPLMVILSDSVADRLLENRHSFGS